jgi:hypothetical protein
MTVQPVAAAALALMLLGSVAPLTAEPKPLRGNRFFTVMERNTLTGKTAAGVSFQLFFVAGGRATYEDDSGRSDHGRWWLDEVGDVCIEWSQLEQGGTQCFQVTLDGDTIAWRGKTGTGSGQLRGTITDGVLEAR